MKISIKQQWTKRAALACLLAVPNLRAFAAEAPKPSELNNSLAIILVTVIVCLLIAIGLLANVVIGSAQLFVERLKEKQKGTAKAEKVVATIAFCLFASTVFAADTPAADAVKEAATTIGGLSKSSFYALLTVIALELVVLFTLLFQLKTFVAKEKVVMPVEEAVVKEPVLSQIWAKLNSFKPEGEVVDTGHSYDGIRELDNSLPKWWLYGFYACVVFSFIYIYRFHVSHTGLSTEQEFQTEMAKAEIEKEQYLKSTANKVDENTVTLLTDAASLAEGKKLFTASCSPCHGAEAQGVVGPNLTDDYWLHKGGVKDVFKTIKYGVQEKGMKSWKDDFSPVQIAQLASFIKSLHGSKPAGAKEPQGEIFKEEAQAGAAATKTADKKLAVN